MGITLLVSDPQAVGNNLSNVFSHKIEVEYVANMKCISLCWDVF